MDKQNESFLEIYLKLADGMRISKFLDEYNFNILDLHIPD